MKRALMLGLAMVLLLVLPEVVYACPVCFDSSDENRQAFLATAAMLTLLPLGMVGGIGLWMRGRFSEMDEAGDGSQDQDTPSSDA